MYGSAWNSGMGCELYRALVAGPRQRPGTIAPQGPRTKARGQPQVQRRRTAQVPRPKNRIGALPEFRMSPRAVAFWLFVAAAGSVAIVLLVHGVWRGVGLYLIRHAGRRRLRASQHHMWRDP